MIVQGHFTPGARLQEHSLSSLLGVSRTPVRDALRALAKEELLNYVPHSGYVVRLFTIDDVLQAFDIRMQLEAAACRMAAEQGISAQHIEALETSLITAEETLSSSIWNNDLHQRWLTLNLFFHEKIVASTSNRYLVNTVAITRAVPETIYDKGGRRYTAEDLRRLYDRAHLRRSLADHVKILDAIRRRQNVRAEYLMREHIFTTREWLRSRFENNEAQDGTSFSYDGGE